MNRNINLDRITESFLKQQMSNILEQYFNIENFLDDDKQHVKEWIIIKLVTVIEQFCREIIKKQLDSKKHKKLPPEFSINVQYIDRAKKIDTHALIASQYNFQNIDSITVLRKTYGVNYSFSMQVNADIEKLFDTRHDIVHTTIKQNYDVKKGYYVVEKLFKTILEKSSLGIEYFDLMRGNYFVSVNKYDQAIDCFTNAIGINKEYILAHKYIAYTYYIKKIFDKVYEHGSIVVDLNSNDKDGYFIKGLALTELDDIDESMNCFNKALKLDPKYIDARYQKGFLLLQKNKPDEAFIEGQIIMAQDPDYKNIHIEMGILALSLKKYGASLKYFDEKLESDVNHAIANYGKSLVLNKLNRRSESKKYYDLAIKLDPDILNTFRKHISF